MLTYVANYMTVMKPNDAGKLCNEIKHKSTICKTHIIRNIYRRPIDIVSSCNDIPPFLPKLYYNGGNDIYIYNFLDIYIYQEISILIFSK